MKKEIHDATTDIKEIKKQIKTFKDLFLQIDATHVNSLKQRVTDLEVAHKKARRQLRDIKEAVGLRAKRVLKRFAVVRTYDQGPGLPPVTALTPVTVVAPARAQKALQPSGDVPVQPFQSAEELEQVLANAVPVDVGVNGGNVPVYRMNKD